MPIMHLVAHNRLGEPNDTCAQAYPIEPNHEWQFLPEDRSDWYRFRLEASARLRVTLSNFVPREGQIALYRGESCGTAVFLKNDGDSSLNRTLDLGDQPAGQYFIFVGNDGPLNEVDYYTLFIDAQ
ncbi:MAG TPA: hypothetical protein VK879_08940 [Candidatus Sulfomarinibacteraceae bacterium]|nr:hypothetical protein [Candidatus Sulfomarinibacteraceae bacterium]